MRRLLLTIAVVLAGNPTAHAVLMELGKSEADYRALGASMAGKLLSLSVNYKGVTGHASAVYLNSHYAITAAHALVLATANGVAVPAGLTTELGTGPNFLSDPGTVVQGGIILVYPSYNGTFYTPDIAIVRFATPLPGPEMHLGSAALDDMVIAAGFGYPAFPGMNGPAQDGFSRGWQARVANGTELDVNDDYYNPAPFGAHKSGLTLNGRGTVEDSGGPWFNMNGELIGISILATGGNSTIGNTDFLDLSNPEVHAWILANTVVPVAHPGDFNSDLIVDAADYVVWRKSSGTTDDYNMWRSHFGQTYSSGSGTGFAMVPEPSTLFLLAMSAVSLLGHRKPQPKVDVEVLL